MHLLTMCPSEGYFELWFWEFCITPKNKIQALMGEIKKIKCEGNTLKKPQNEE